MEKAKGKQCPLVQIPWEPLSQYDVKGFHETINNQDKSHLADWHQDFRHLNFKEGLGFIADI